MFVYDAPSNLPFPLNYRCWDSVCILFINSFHPVLLIASYYCYGSYCLCQFWVQFITKQTRSKEGIHFKAFTRIRQNLHRQILMCVRRCDSLSQTKILVRVNCGSSWIVPEQFCPVQTNLNICGTNVAISLFLWACFVHVEVIMPLSWVSSKF